jgi:LacI family transcriptional regulator
VQLDVQSTLESARVVTIMKRKTSILFLLAWNDYRIFQGISRYAHQAGWQMDTRHFFLNIFPKDSTFQGMIAMYHNDPAVRAYIREKAEHMPTVILGTQNPGVKAPMVMPDNRASGRLAADHLFNLFHKHYGWFACDTCPSGKERKLAFEGRLREQGFTCVDLSCGKASFHATAVIHKLKQSPKPIGVMARDDHDAAVLLDLCQRAGLRTPEEVAVIGVGDLESLCAFSPLPVSSISLNMDELGFQSAVVLDQLMRGKPVPDKSVIPPGPLTQRLSTGCLAITHPDLRVAVNKIDKEYKTLLTMDDLALAAGISRRQLYLLFENEMRCSPCDYLLNVRLEHARKLVTENKLHLNEIAQVCGFNTPRTLHRVFLQRFGLSPSKWAKKL